MPSANVGKSAVANSAGSENHGNIGRGAGGIKKVARNGSVYAGFEEPEGGRDGRGMQKDTRERISGKGPSTLGLMECKK